MDSTLHPITWNDLPSIHDVPRLDESDTDCLSEIKVVLERHGKMHRFGLALLHQHFVLADDELLLEHCDFERRTLVTQPVKATELIRQNYIPTIWRFDGARAQACAYCPKHGDRHDGYKEQH